MQSNERADMISGRPISEQASQRTFMGVAMLLFAASAVMTLAWCDSMPASHGVSMPGGWTLSMMWMRMPGQTWPGAAATFLGMWLAMMVAMMLPSLTPMLWRYRRAVAPTSPERLDRLTAVVGTAYFVVWTELGAVAFLAGTTLAALEMRLAPLARGVPATTGAIVLIAGALQFSGWKSHHLACCRGTAPCGDTFSADVRSAWKHGLRLGVHCVHCCLGLTVILLVIGMMNLYAMALVTAAISAERLAPGGMRAARVIGVILVAAGQFLIARAVPA